MTVYYLLFLNLHRSRVLFCFCSECLLNSYFIVENELLYRYKLLSSWIRSQRTHYWTDSSLCSVDSWWGL